MSFLSFALVHPCPLLQIQFLFLFLGLILAQLLLKIKPDYYVLDLRLFVKNLFEFIR